jgi:hypothetical protein
MGSEVAPGFTPDMPPSRADLHVAIRVTHYTRTAIVADPLFQQDDISRSRLLHREACAVSQNFTEDIQMDGESQE